MLQALSPQAGGGAFQSGGAVMAKAQSPLVFSFDIGKIRRAPPEDLRLRAGS